MSPKRGITAKEYVEQGRLLAIANWADPSKIQIIDLATGQIAHTLEGHQRAVRALAVSPECKALASASRDHTVQLWDLIKPGDLGRIIKPINGDNAL